MPQQEGDAASGGGGYVLGVDLGTTFTAAAISRRGITEIVPLGDHAPQIPSAVFLTDSGEYVIGDAAIRRGHTEPGRLAREFKRRIGDDTNVILGSTPISAQALMAQLLARVVDHVTVGQGEAPRAVVLTHPANWGPYRLELLNQAARMAGLADARLCSEPEAAAIHFASTNRVEVGQTIAVYDLGGGTFDAAVLRKDSTGFSVLGTPEGIEHLGGLDFDAVVLHHIQETLGPLDIEPDDPNTLTALTRLTRDCTEAKEALSTDNDVTIPVSIGAASAAVRLSRLAFEEAIRPSLEETISALQRSLNSADVTADDLAAIVLIGGSSRIPLVTHLLTQHLGRPIALSPQPKHAVALGASVLDGAQTDDPRSKVMAPVSGAAHAEPAADPPSQARTTSGTRKGGRRGAVVIAAAVLLALAGFAVAAPSLFGGSESPSPEPAGASSQAAEPVTVTLHHFGDASYAALAAEYEDLNPHVTVEVIKAEPGGSDSEALRDNIRSGAQTADIEQISAGWMSELMTVSDGFADLESTDVEGRWSASTTEPATTDTGKLIGYGTDLGTLAVCYRPDLLQAAGMPADRQDVADMMGSTWEDYFAVGRTFVATSDAAWFASADRVLDVMVQQQETAYENQDGEIIVDDSGRLRELYDQILTASVTEGLSAGLPRSGPEWEAALQDSTFATTFCPSWLLDNVEASAGGIGQWDIAPMLPGGGATYGGSYLMVPQQGEVVEEAIALAAWLTAPDQQTQIYQQTGAFPSQVQAWESQEVLGVTNPFFNNAPVGQIYARNSALLSTPPYKGPHYRVIHSALRQAVKRVDLSQTETPDASWDIFLADVQNLP
ncbi:MAG: extracellular solute-binding protein [Ornithinimicrobium sp.]